MKFQQLGAFEKHLEKAAPDHLSRVYLVVAPCAFERRKICEAICSAIRKKVKSIAIVRLDGKEVELADLREELDSASFLGGQRVVIVDEVDKLKKNALAALPAYVVRPSAFVYLLLGAASAKNLSELYEQGKKELIVCDLSAEKPWERKERLRTYLLQRAGKEGKALTREAADLLLERTGAELSLLDQEIDKLLCYCLHKQQITGLDVQALCGAEKLPSIWQMAETIVWQGKAVAADSSFEFSSLLFLLTHMRSHLQQGMQLAASLQAGVALREISLPFFKPQVLEKVAPIAKVRSMRFFKEGIHALFEVECLAKNGSLAPCVLLDLLVAKMVLLSHG